MERVIVTGATSMIGEALIEECLKHGISVCAVIRKDTARKDRLPQDPHLELVECSLEELADNLDRICCYSGCETMADVAYHFSYELNTLGEIPSSLQYYIDCEAYGRDLEIEGYFIQTRYGMCEIK